MFTEVPLRNRFAIAAQSGFRAVEIQAPYEEPPVSLAERVKEAEVEVVLINTPVALAAVPGEEEAFHAGFERALEYANELSCRQIHCLAGRTDRSDAHDTFVGNVRWAAQQSAAHDIDILLEPLNTTDNPGYFLTGSEQARQIIEAVDCENVRLQCDFYHLQIMEGHLSETLTRHFDVIGHIQISGVPGRHEPDVKQEINYPYLLQLIDELGYDGWVGCEYRPRCDTLEGLTWAQPYGISTPIATPDDGSLA